MQKMQLVVMVSQKKMLKIYFHLVLDSNSGNHAWDQREMLSFIEDCPKIIRALNYPKGVPGKGYYKFNY